MLRSAHPDLAELIDWWNPRLVCVATGFTRYDQHAVQQIARSIELVRYRDFGGELLVLELVHPNSTVSATTAALPAAALATETTDEPVADTCRRRGRPGRPGADRAVHPAAERAVRDDHRPLRDAR